MKVPSLFNRVAENYYEFADWEYLRPIYDVFLIAWRDHNDMKLAFNAYRAAWTAFGETEWDKEFGEHYADLEPAVPSAKRWLREHPKGK